MWEGGMTRREYNILLAQLKAGEIKLKRDEHGKLIRVFSKKDLDELHSLGYIDEPKNFLDEEAYIDMLYAKAEESRIKEYGEQDVI